MTGSRDVRGRMVAALVSLLVLAGAAAMLSGCNTAAGMGQDISGAGHAITGGADATKQALPPTPSPNQ